MQRDPIAMQSDEDDADNTSTHGQYVPLVSPQSTLPLNSAAARSQKEITPTRAHRITPSERHTLNADRFNLQPVL